MTADQRNEAAQFYQFVGEQIRHGTNLSPEELLDTWRDVHPVDDDEELLADVREAIAGLAAGNRGTPAEECFRQLRREFGISEE